MFDIDLVSSEAGLEHSNQDFEAELEPDRVGNRDLSDELYERHMRRVVEIDSSMARWSLSHLELIDKLIEADENRLWAEDGSPSLAEWLTARYRLTTVTGRTLARIVKALPELPMIRRAFESGRLSWDQLHAAVSVATPEIDGDLAETAPGMKPSDPRDRKARRRDGGNRSQRSPLPDLRLP